MGLSAPSSSPTPTQGPEGSPETPKDLNFGERLSAYAKERFPIASGIAGQVLNGGPSAPPVQIQAQDQPNYSDMIAMNAKPPAKEGGGLEMLLKLFGG